MCVCVWGGGGGGSNFFLLHASYARVRQSDLQILQCVFHASYARVGQSNLYHIYYYFISYFLSHHILWKGGGGLRAGYACVRQSDLHCLQSVLFHACYARVGQSNLHFLLLFNRLFSEPPQSKRFQLILIII